MTGIHRLQHVKCFFAADFADDDAVGAHAETIDKELTLANRSHALDVGGTGLQPDNILLCKLQFRGVLDGHEPLILRYVLREDIQERRLARTCAAGHEDTDPGANCCSEHFNHFYGDTFELDQLVRRDRTSAEPANRESRTVKGQWRN